MITRLLFLARRRLRRPFLVAPGSVVAALFWMAVPGPPPLQTAKPLESQVKAAYLLNFGRFATWPTGGRPLPATGGFAVCVIGRDPFGSVLDSVVSGETIAGLPVVVKRIDRPDETAGCRILYISASERPRLKQILQALDGANTLTVSDIPKFVDDDGMIQFVPEGNRVRFAVNVQAAERAGLALGSELLRVAASVTTRTGTTRKP